MCECIGEDVGVCMGEGVSVCGGGERKRQRGC